MLLKDVFDASLEEIADAIGTTTGAVKAALHRGREKLRADEPRKARPSPDPAAIDRFCAAYDARDRDALLALMLDTASIEMTGVDLEIGRKAFSREPVWFTYNLGGIPGLPAERQPVSRWLPVAHEGETLALVLTAWGGPEQLASVMRFETEDGRIARIRVYAFCPDTVREIGAAHGLSTPQGWYSFTGMMQGMAEQMAKFQ